MVVAATPFLLVILPHLFGLAVVSLSDWPIGTSVSILRVSGTLIALAGACVLCCHWWVTRNPGSAWVGAAVLALAITQLPSTFLEFDSVTATAIQTRSTLLDTLLALPFVVLLVFATGPRTFRRRITPFLLGTAVGAAFGTVRLVSTGLQLEDSVPGAPLWVGLATSAILGGFVVLIVRRIETLPSWARKETIIAAVAITAGRMIGLDGLGDNLWDIAASGMMLAGFLLFASTATELLRDGLGDNERKLERSIERAEAIERTHRDAQETLHELRGAIAGIGSASRILIGMHEGLSAAQQKRLATLMSLEMGRLERLLAGPRAAPKVLPLDPLISSLAASYRYLGVPVHSIPSGASAWADENDLNDVLHVLLNNAARHAPGSTTKVWVRQRFDRVELHVSDDGPGIPPAVRGHLFDRGVRDDDSQGEGLGLYIARKALARQGASLDLAEDRRHGTTFVVGLPLREPA